MIGTVLAFANLGMSVMGANEKQEQAEEQQRFVRHSETLNRRLIATEATAASETLARGLRTTLGQQRAGFGFLGVAGGATPNTFEMESRAAAARDQEAIDFTAALETSLSQQAERAGVARAAAQSAQANLDLFASSINFADTINTIGEQNRGRRQQPNSNAQSAYPEANARMA